MRGDVRDRLATTEAPFIRRSKYCESTPRSQVNLSHDSSRARRAVGRACELPLGSATGYSDIRKSRPLLMRRGDSGRNIVAGLPNCPAERTVLGSGRNLIFRPASIHIRYY